MTLPFEEQERWWVPEKYLAEDTLYGFRATGSGREVGFEPYPIGCCKVEMGVNLVNFALSEKSSQSSKGERNLFASIQRLRDKLAKPPCGDGYSDNNYPVPSLVFKDDCSLHKNAARFIFGRNVVEKYFMRDSNRNQSFRNFVLERLEKAATIEQPLFAGKMSWEKTLPSDITIAFGAKLSLESSESQFLVEEIVERVSDLLVGKLEGYLPNVWFALNPKVVGLPENTLRFYGRESNKDFVVDFKLLESNRALFLQNITAFIVRLVLEDQFAAKRKS